MNIRERDVWKFRRHWVSDVLEAAVGEVLDLTDPEVLAELNTRMAERMPADQSYPEQAEYSGLDPQRVQRHFARTLTGGAEAMQDYFAARADDASKPTGAWDLVGHMVSAGDPPTAAELEPIVRDSLPPPDLQDFLADTLAGDVRQRRGPQRPTGEDWASRGVVAHRVRRWQRAFKRRKQRTGRISDPYREALDKVSTETGIRRHTLDKWCYPRR